MNKQTHNIVEQSSHVAIHLYTIDLRLIYVYVVSFEFFLFVNYSIYVAHVVARFGLYHSDVDALIFKIDFQFSVLVDTASEGLITV